jgi:hypothetical protein
MVTRMPPYELQYIWRRAEGGASVDTHKDLTRVSRELGRAEFNLGGRGVATTHRGVGIYFNPPTRNGMLTLSSNPSFYSYYWNAGFFHGAVTRAWLGFVVESFNATDIFFDRGLVTQRLMIFDRDIP